MKLRSRLLWLLLAMGLPLALLSVVLVLRVVQTERDTKQQAMVDLARTLAAAVDTEVQRSTLALQLLATSAHLQFDAQGRIAPEALARFRREAETARSLHGLWTNVILAREDGERLLNLRIPLDQATPKTNSRRALDPLKAGVPTVSDVFVSPTSGKPAVSVSVPILPTQGPGLTLAATLDFDTWTVWLKARIPANAVAAIDDARGNVIARSEAPEQFVAQPAHEALRQAYGVKPESVVGFVNRQGRAIYAAYATSRLTGWHALIVMDQAVINSGVHEEAIKLAAVIGTVILLGLLLAAWFARPIERGMHALTRSVVALGRGERPRVHTLSGIEELDVAQEAARRSGDLLVEQAERVATLQRELASRAEQAEEANEQKDRFLSMVSHELRSPLAAISSATTVALMQKETARDDMVRIIQRQAKHLSAMVDDLLDASRARVGKLTVRRIPVDLAELTGQVLETFQSTGAFGEHRVAWEVAPVAVVADPHRILQVIRNLLDNALKFTPPGGHIDVRVGRDDDWATFSIRDTGRGIPDDMMSTVFEPFVQARGESARHGLGLGLTIVREIVSLHEGQIEVNSDGPGHGTQFIVRVPCAPDAPDHKRSSEIETPGV